MLWIYLLGALVFPPVFILWRPRERLSPRAQRFRLAASVVVVWLLAILWSLGGALQAGPKEGMDIDERNYSDPLLPRPSDRGDDGDPEAPARLPTTVPARAPKEPGDPDEISDKKDQDIAWGWTYEGPPDTALTLMLGWIPGLAYAGLLMLARRSLAPQTEDGAGYEGEDQQGWLGQQRGGGPYA
jgi:hypothetical protein